MFTYIYDKDNGQAWSDGAAFRIMEGIVNHVNAGGSFEFIGSTENTLLALRVLIKRGSIKQNQVTCMYRNNNEDIVIPINEDGEIYTRPDGFADFDHKMFNELFDWIV